MAQILTERSQVGGPRAGHEDKLPLGKKFTTRISNAIRVQTGGSMAQALKRVQAQEAEWGPLFIGVKGRGRDHILCLISAWQTGGAELQGGCEEEEHM